MPTRSKPMVSCRSSAWAIATLVPTRRSMWPARDAQLRERAGVEQSGEAADAAHDFGTAGLATHFFISSTARSPASMSTPAAAYADLSASVSLWQP
jgi:hypothetical protein